MTEFLANAFIVWLLVFMWFWDYPRDHPTQPIIRHLCKPLVYIGLWHGWSMFAPNPIRTNRRLHARIFFDQESPELWHPIWARTNGKLLDMFYLRTFKYQHSVASGEASVLCEPLCQFLAAQCRLNSRSVTRIELIREFQAVNPPGHAEPYGPKGSVVFYEYTFDTANQEGHGRLVKHPQLSSPSPVEAPQHSG